MMPALTSGLMTVLCALRLIIGLRMPGNEGETKGKKKIIDIPPKSLITMMLVLAYAIAIKSVGFVITTFIYMVVQMTVLQDGKKKWGIIIILSLVMSAGIYLLFTRIFNIMLPAGILSFL